jgi:putative FmdB family regulatory protein
MPIYAYKCESCGHRQDILQKVSEPLLQICPACAQPRFVKQLTAAGFQLKGSGWYATDFRGGTPAAPADSGETKPAETAAAAPAAPAAPAVPKAAAATPTAADKPRAPPSDAA